MMPAPRTTLAVLAALLAGAVAAQPAPGPAPAVSAAAPLPVSAFARHSNVSHPRLSPDGKHLLVRMDDKDGRHHALVVYKVADLSMTSILRMPIYQLPLNATWVSNDWIVMEIGRLFGSLDQPLNTGQVIATNISGDKQRYLFGYDNRGRRAATRGSDRASGYIVSLPRQRNGHVYLRAVPWDNDEVSVLYDVNVPENTRKTLARIGVTGMEFLVDPAGQAAYAFGTNNRFEYVTYRHGEDGWRQLPAENTHGEFEPIAFAADGKQVYALVNQDDGPAKLVKSSLDGRQQTVLAADGFASVGSVQWTAEPSQPFAVMLQADVPAPLFIDADGEDARLYRALAKAFPGRKLHFLSYSEDGDKVLFATASDRDPGTYYLISKTDHKVHKLFDVADWLDPAAMAERIPMRFKASDGMMLEAILTFPRNLAHKNLPMVLMPHGGPYGVRDSWYFDNDAQFLANRGYLVLQVNFRGSLGRGLEFQMAGYREWGGRIQQDLIDGVRWAIAKGYADKNRVCVYGASFGGYSALMSVIRAPELFRCAVGYAGIYDLGLMFEKGDIQASDSGMSYLQTVLGEEQAKLAANSPAKLAAKVGVPVFLVHGEADERAPFEHAKRMREALQKAGKPVEWLSFEDEGHGFYTVEHRTTFLTRLQEFLAANLTKPTAKPAAGDAPQPAAAASAAATP